LPNPRERVLLTARFAKNIAATIIHPAIDQQIIKPSANPVISKKQTPNQMSRFAELSGEKL